MYGISFSQNVFYLYWVKVNFFMRVRIFLLKASSLVLTAFLFLSSEYSYSQQVVTSGTPIEKIYSRPVLGPFPWVADTVAIEVKAIEVANTTFAINDSTPISLIDIDTATIQYIPPGIIIPNIPIVSGNDPASGKIHTGLFDFETDLLIDKFAEMIEMSPDDIDNFPLYRFIDQWYGVRYKYGGVTSKGIDCSAFSQKLYGNIYSTNILRTARQQHRSSEIVKDYNEANEGDLVFFRIHRLRVSHVGVYLANGYFVHASRSRGVMISSLNDKYWQRRYAGCGKIEREGVITESDYLDN